MELMHKGRAVSPILLALALGVLAGCNGGGKQPMASSSFSTSNIYAYMKAVQDGNGTVTTTVQLRDGPANTAAYLYLSNGDALYSTLDVPPGQYLNLNGGGNLFNNSLATSQHLKVASQRDIYNDYQVFIQTIAQPEYFTLDTQSSGSTSTRVYVDFERQGTLTGDSSVVLPPSFQISAPAANASISRAASPTVALTWTNVDATTTMELDAAGSCVDGSRYTLHRALGTDTGTFSLTTADYFPATGVSTATSCRVALLLSRVRLGGVSPQFAFGSFTGVQRRTVQFTSTP